MISNHFLIPASPPARQPASPPAASGQRPAASPPAASGQRPAASGQPASPPARQPASPLPNVRQWFAPGAIRARRERLAARTLVCDSTLVYAREHSSVGHGVYALRSAQSGNRNSPGNSSRGIPVPLVLHLD